MATSFLGRRLQGQRRVADVGPQATWMLRAEEEQSAPRQTQREWCMIKERGARFSQLRLILRNGRSCYSRPGTASMKDRIAIKPQVHFGKPCVAGTRIPVQSVLELVREGLSLSDIIRDYYPDLLQEDIRACVQYAIDVVAAEDFHLATTP